MYEIANVVINSKANVRYNNYNNILNGAIIHNNGIIIDSIC